MSSCKNIFQNTLLTLFFVFIAKNIVYGTHKHDEEAPFTAHDSKFHDSKVRSHHANIIPYSNSKRVLTFTVSARNLSLQTDDEVNPKVVMFYKTNQSDLNSQSTETILKNRNPDWMKIFKFLWQKGQKQNWQVKVKSMAASKVEIPIGEVTVNVDEFNTAMEYNTEFIVSIQPENGELIFKKSKLISFKLSAKNLAKKDTFGGKSDPYVKCSWSRGPDGPTSEFARTAWIGNVVDVEWMEVITFEGYQKGTDQYLHLQIYDDDEFTDDDFLGEAFVKLDDTVNKKSSNSNIRVLELVNEPKKTNGKGSLTVKFMYT